MPAAVTSRRLGSTPHLAPQDDQLMSEHRILRFKAQLRLERRGQDGQSEAEQPDHSASLGVSITSSTRMRFSVRTGRLLALKKTPCPDRKFTGAQLREAEPGFDLRAPRAGHGVAIQDGTPAAVQDHVMHLNKASVATLISHNRNSSCCCGTGAFINEKLTF